MDSGIIENFDPELRRAFDFAEDHVDPKLVDHQKVKMHKDKVKLSGDAAFYTLQGEGPTMGLPAVFLRTHVCNLQCTWCDAWYTWNPKTPEFWTEGRDVSFEECVELIHSAWEREGPAITPKRVIFTGGEPLIQRKQLEAVDRYGLFPHWQVEVETNGTLMPTEWALEQWQFNVSPKLSNSDNREGSMVKPKILKALNEVNSTFKFVCMVEDDIREIFRLYSQHLDMDNVIIMPQGITEEEVSANAKVLAEPCKKHGLRLMPRLQAICWDGARRGV